MTKVPLTQPDPSATAPLSASTGHRRVVLASTGEAGNDATRGLTDSVTLMAAALDDALRAFDAPARDMVRRRIGLVAAMVGSDDSPDPAGALAAAAGLHGATTMVAAIGVPQQRLVSNAVLAVGSGATDAVLVLGGEAKASSLTARRSGRDAPSPARGDGPDHPLHPEGELMAGPEVAAGLWDPYAQYALIDSALARSEGASPSELLTEVSSLWERFDRVAAENPDARFAGPPHDAAALATTSQENRLLAFPYNKWHSTQWALDQATALLICSEELALGAGLDGDQLLHPQVALDSSFGASLSQRSELHRWPTMEVLGRVASEHLGCGLAALPTVELYSCFPAAVRVQQRELGLPLGGTPTITGGMPFAGGPFNHFTYMATAALRRRMLQGSSAPQHELGMVTTVSGLLTKGGLMVWGREPHPEGPLVADVAAAARAATAQVEVADFEEARAIEPGDRVLAATVTGGFDPRLFAIVDDRERRRRVVATELPDGNPAEVLAALG